MAFVSDGFRAGVFSDPAALAAQLRRAGMGSAALQIGATTRDEVLAFDRAGLDVVLWGIPDDGDHRRALADLGGIVDGYVLQIENDAQYAAAVANVQAGVGANLPRAVVTTFEGVNTGHNGKPVYPPERMEPFRRAGIATAFVECYRGDDPSHGDLAAMMRQAKTFGWEHAIPVVGLYGSDRLGDYPQLADFGNEWSFWRTEQIDPRDWAVLEAQAASH